MMGLLDSFLSAGKGKVLDSSALRRKLTEAQSRHEAAIEAVTTAQERYRELLLAEDPADANNARAAVTAAEVERDRAAALAQATAQRLEERVAEEIETERRVTYDTAVQTRQAALRRLGEYSALAQEIAAIVEDVARAELDIREANRDLPVGAEPLRGVEASTRHRPGAAAETISERVEDAGWYHLPATMKGLDSSIQEFANSRVSDAAQARVEVRNRGDRIGILNDGGRRSVVVKRRRRYTESTSAMGEQVVQSLATSLHLPALRHGETHFWKPLQDAPAHSPGEHAAIASATLKQAERLAAGRAAPVADQRQPNVQRKNALVAEPDLIAEARRFEERTRYDRHEGSAS